MLTNVYSCRITRCWGQERAGGREQFRVGESRLFRPFLPVFEAFFMLQVKSRDRILIPTVSLAGPVAARSSAALDFAVLGEFFLYLSIVLPEVKSIGSFSSGTTLGQGRGEDSSWCCFLREYCHRCSV